MSDYTTSERLTLTAEDLLAGTAAIYDIVIPPNLLQPGAEAASSPEMVVRVRPLTLGTFLLIIKAAKDDSSLIPLLMIQESLVEPKVSLGQVRQMNLGLITYLIGCIRQISGLAEKKLSAEVEASPLAQAAFRLARAFGWTPQQLHEMTMAQMNLYLHFLDEEHA